MADPLEQIVQRMIDASESEDNIAAVIQQSRASSPESIVAKARTTAASGNVDAANDEFFKIPAEERKKRGLYAGPGGADTTSAGALALGGAVAPWTALARSAGTGILRTIENPIVGGALGAYHGYQKNGLIGALEGGAAGALSSGFVRGANKLLPAATRYLEAGAAAKAAPQMAKPLEMLPRVEEMATAARASGLPGNQISSMVDQLKRDFLLRTLGNSRY